MKDSPGAGDHMFETLRALRRTQLKHSTFVSNPDVVVYSSLPKTELHCLSFLLYDDISSDLIFAPLLTSQFLGGFLF